ncbi:MAG: hypothetical protein ACI837_001437 [Crocinitomicaceae bacterium]|jgi:hypothetical protein
MPVRVSLWVLLLLFSNGTHAQDLDTLNQTIDGKKQGHWIYYGRDRPSAGYSRNGIIEEGSYQDDRKTGNWKKYRPDGTLKLSGNYLNNRPTGAFVRYDEKGDTLEVGDFTRGTIGQPNPGATWVNPEIKEQVAYNVAGNRFEVDSMNFDKHIIVTYTKPVDQLAMNIFKIEGDILVPHKSFRMADNGSEFKMDGHNRLKDQQGDTWIIGTFSKGRFMTGEFYCYSTHDKVLYLEKFKDGESIEIILF